MTDERVRAAEFEVDRGALKDDRDAARVSRHVEPHRLMEEAWEKAKDKGADLAENAVDAVKARPLAATGVVTAIAMFLAREPLMELAGKLVDGARQRRESAARPAGR